MSGFVHLHVHSEYSLLDGAARISALAARASELGMPALALTDHGVMYGAIPFYKACKQAGVKPIIGCEVYVAGKEMGDKGTRQEHPIYHLTLLAKNETGYRNLMKLSSEAHLRGFHYKPRIDFPLLERHAEGLICLSGCLNGEVPRLLLQGKDDEARAVAMRYRNLFQADYYFEMQDHQLLDQRRLNQKLLRLAAELEVPLVATNDVHYIFKEDAEVQDLLLCIGTGKTLDDPHRMKMDSDQMYLKSAAEMAGLFTHVPEAIHNTLRISEKCQLEIDFERTLLPRFLPADAPQTAEQLLRAQCERGFAERYRAEDAEARARLAYELDVIVKMGFADYFLIVWDLLRYAHDQGIVVGPGRGSSAGSLVAYVLRITDVDPLRYHLLFERFLNPERISLPDIDMDLSDERRGEVIAYATSKYGADRVAQIATFGTLAARMAVRDTGRVLNLPFYEVDKVAKLIGEQSGSTIEEALQESSELQAFAEQSKNVAKLLGLAQKIEGMPRTVSTHAAGIVISPAPLDHYVPLQQGATSTPLTQYSMEHVEAVGLVKIDFLGLRTLSVMERAIDFVRRDHSHDIDFRLIPDNDPKTYEMLSRGETLGVFQLESSGMRRVLRELKPTNFEDLISVLALFRPGPMEFISQYIRSKHGQMAVVYPHADLEPILRDTYGIIVYQEQIMKIANQMAGFSLGEADLLRRAVSKKKREILDEQRSHFVEGCLKKGYLAEDAHKVYDLIVRFADYGFPRAHATAYAVLAFQTAWLRAHYPAAFMASMMTAVVNSQDKIAEYVEACKVMGIRVLPPDVNESGMLFTMSSTGDIRFGLAAIKNVGFRAVEGIMHERATEPFRDLSDFVRRMDLSVCNKRILESLILAGAMDTFPHHRRQMLAVLDELVEETIKWKKQKSEFELDLFGFTEQQPLKVEYPEVQSLTTRERLEQEKELIGVYLSGHPLDSHASLMQSLQHVPLQQLAECENKSKVRVVGMVMSTRQIVTKKGQPMAFVELEDKVKRCEVVLFPKVWEQAKAKVQDGAVLVVDAVMEQDEETVKLLADRVWTPEEAVQSKANNKPGVNGNKPPRLMLKVSEAHMGETALARLESILLSHRGPVQVVLFDEVNRSLIQLHRRFSVRPTASLVAALEQVVGAGNVILAGV